MAYEKIQEKRCFEHNIAVEKGSTFKVLVDSSGQSYIRTIGVGTEPEDLPDGWQVVQLVAAVDHAATIWSGTTVNIITDSVGNQYLELPSEEAIPKG